MTGHFRKLKELKAMLDEASSSATDLVNLIAAEPGWQWANSASFLDKLRNARTFVEDGKLKNSFWRAWVHEIDFVSVIKKNFTRDAILVEMGDPYKTMLDNIERLKGR